MFILIMLMLGLAFLLLLISAFGGSLPQVNLVWLALAIWVLAELIAFVSGTHVGIGHG